MAADNAIYMPTPTLVHLQVDDAVEEMLSPYQNDSAMATSLGNNSSSQQQRALHAFMSPAPQLRHHTPTLIKLPSLTTAESQTPMVDANYNQIF